MCVNKGECDVCGLLALPFPFTHFTGNFFTASCSYIAKLLPPREFVIRMSEVTGKALVQKLEGRLIARLLPDAPHHFGIGRFASEHWVGSHPSAKICDVSQSPQIDTWRRRDSPLPAEEFKFHMYPRHPPVGNWSYISLSAPGIIDVFIDTTLRTREYYLLAGNLLRWSELYNATPPEDSWVWKWYVL
jgi:hypothetical protein